jgi:hypothetical protein
MASWPGANNYEDEDEDYLDSSSEELEEEDPAQSHPIKKTGPGHSPAAKNKPKANTPGRKEKGKGRAIEVSDESSEEVEAPALVKKPRRIRKQASPDHFIPNDIYGENWTEAQEADLRKRWKKKLGVLTNGMDTSEISLWKKSYQIYQKPPPAIIPSGMEVDVSENAEFEDPDNPDAELEDKNWSQEFCKGFGEVLCCEAFKDRLYFLQYVLRYALFLRLGASKGFPKPPRKELSVQRNQKVIAEFDRLAAINGIAADPLRAETLNDALNNMLGPDLPSHVGLIEQLKKVVRKDFQDQRGLIKRDIDNIILAWDQYATASKQGLLSMKEYGQKWNKEHTKASSDPKGAEKYHTDDILKLRKEWVLGCKRAEAKAEAMRIQEPIGGVEGSRPRAPYVDLTMDSSEED